MDLQSGFRLMVGAVVLITAILGAAHSAWWLVIPGLIGVSMIQSAFTGLCPGLLALEKLGLEEECASEGSPEERQA